MTPWNSWITGEEEFSTSPSGARHGYQFDVPAHGGGGSPAVPLKAMGRFKHEACCVDPSTYYVYETEDGPSAPGDLASGFYRFIPNSRGRNPDLSKGGILQMLKIVGVPNMNFAALAAPGAQPAP